MNIINLGEEIVQNKNDKNLSAILEELRILNDNLSRLLLLNGGGEYVGTKTIFIKPKSFVQIEYITEKASRQITVLNPSRDKVIYLYSNKALKEEGEIKLNAYPLHPGGQVSFLLEYKEALYAFNDDPKEDAKILVSVFAERLCKIRT